jgi:predicted ATP-grasp superfamily ATP-dependent carboligase
VTHPEETLNGLRAAGEKLSTKGVLFPCSDSFVLFLSRYRVELGELFSFCIPSPEVLEGMINKRKQYEMAERIGTPLAQTYYPSTMKEVDRVAGLLSYPAFIKPYYSHLWYGRFGNKGFKVQDSQELRARYHEIFSARLEALVQSIIQGPNTNHVKVSAYYGLEGRRLALFLTRKLRQYPTEFGVGTVMSSFHDEAVADIGTRFFEGIGYQGIGSIELKLDDKDGQYKLIELNPRLWAQNSQATAAGVNFPLVQYLDVTGQRPAPATNYRDDVRWRDSLEDIQAFWWYHSRGQTTWGDLARSWLRTDCHAYYAPDDVGPAFAHVRGGVYPAQVLAGMLKRERNEKVRALKKKRETEALEIP